MAFDHSEQITDLFLWNQTESKKVLQKGVKAPIPFERTCTLLGWAPFSISVASM